ncbi:MAG TPA: hypothetical protein VFV75_09060 [Candidatus Polarisedimenticolaceae bacterium]|nr:hypothetical protein [Candidatus Polarisedimenticolaceae bacterium]
MVPALPVVDAAPSAPPPTPEMPALDAALFGSGHASVSVRSPRARTRPFVEEGEPAGAPALVPLGLAAVGAAAAWFAAPRLAAWMSPLPFAVEPWMMGAAGAAFGLLLGGAWLEWRAGRR